MHSRGRARRARLERPVQQPECRLALHHALGGDRGCRWRRYCRRHRHCRSHGSPLETRCVHPQTARRAPAAPRTRPFAGRRSAHVPERGLGRERNASFVGAGGGTRTLFARVTSSTEGAEAEQLATRTRESVVFMRKAATNLHERAAGRDPRVGAAAIDSASAAQEALDALAPFAVLGRGESEDVHVERKEIIADHLAAVESGISQVLALGAALAVVPETQTLHADRSLVPTVPRPAQPDSARVAVVLQRPRQSRRTDLKPSSERCSIREWPHSICSSIPSRSEPT